MAASLDLLSFGEFMLEFSKNSVSLGGDSLNALTAAGYLGLKCGLHSSVAKDENQNQIEKILSTLPVQVFSHPATGKNGKYTITTDSKGERSFEYDRKGSAASHLPEVLKEIDWNTKCLFLSGVAQALSPKWTELVAGLLKQAKQQKVLTAFDINFRPKLWQQSQAISALKNILPLIDILFVSEDDLPVLHEAMGSSDLKTVFLAGPKVCIFRKGALGSGYLKSNGELEIIPSPKIKPVDTSGCGDVFSGTFLAKYLKGDSLEAACGLATTLASKHAEYPGALPRPELFLGVR